MKAIAFAQRLLRDLKEKDLASLTADSRLELVDAMNGALARIHAGAPHHSKITPASITLPAPTLVSITATNGSTEFTGHDATDEDLYCTVRIDGDAVDNQIMADGTLLFPYDGETGTHNATIYHDACRLPEPVEEIVKDPEDIVNRERLTQDQLQENRMQSGVRYREREVRRPILWWVENNGSNQGADSPLVFRVDSLPPETIRLKTEVSQGPARLSFQSILDGTAIIPLRHEQIEAYLLPIARGLLSSSSLWRRPETAIATQASGESALEMFRTLVPSTTTTPANKVYTPANF